MGFTAVPDAKHSNGLQHVLADDLKLVDSVAERTLDQVLQRFSVNVRRRGARLANPILTENFSHLLKKLLEWRC